VKYLIWLRKDWSHFISAAAGIEMCVKFWKVAIPDYYGFAVGIGAVTVAIFTKHFWDAKTDALKNEEK
jgi:hypothetical protein